MEYIIIPTEVYEQADMTLAKKLGLDNPRKSVDGSEVIMHIECYNRLFKDAPTTFRANPYPVYDGDNEELQSLLNSDLWTTNENF